MPGEPAEPSREAGGEDDDPEQRDAEPERGEHQVLPPRLERARLAAEADEQRRHGGRRLDEQPGDAEVARQRHGEQDGPERVEQGEVRLLAPRPGSQRAAHGAEVGGRDEHAREAYERRHPEQQPAGGVDCDPVPERRVVPERERRQGQRERASRQRAGESHRRHEPPGHGHDEQRRERRNGDHRDGKQLAASHAGPAGRTSRPCRTRRRSRCGTPPRPERSA